MVPSTGTYITCQRALDLVVGKASLAHQTSEKSCRLQAGINYGPPGNKQLVYFVDDLNMPKLDPYETAMPISLIRQHLGWGHWFDRQKLTQKNIHNTQ